MDLTYMCQNQKENTNHQESIKYWQNLKQFWTNYGYYGGKFIQHCHIDTNLTRQDCTEHMHCEIPLSTQISEFNIQIFIVDIGWHELLKWKKWTWDDKFSHTAGKLWPAETCCELTHSHQWNEKMAKLKMKWQTELIYFYATLAKCM